MQLRELLAAQRLRLADQLTRLSPNEWETETLCEGWTVRHVVAHVTMPFRHGTVSFLLGMVRARGDFNRFADRVAQRDATLPTAELVRRVRGATHGPGRPQPGHRPTASHPQRNRPSRIRRRPRASSHAPRSQVLRS